MHRIALLLAIAGAVRIGFCDIQTGLIGHWALDEADGAVAYDSSSIGTNLDVFSLNDIVRVKGIAGGACQFTMPSAGPIRIDQAPDTFRCQNFTGAAWIRLQPGGGGGDIVSVNDVWMIRVENQTGIISFVILNRVGPDSTWGPNGFQYYYLQYPDQIAGTSYFDGLWHHVVCTKSEDRVAIYIDGTLGLAEDTAMTLVAYPNQPKYRDVTTFRLSIGGHPYEAAYAIRDGVIDDVRIYNRAFSADDVAQLFRATAPNKVFLILPDSTTNVRETIVWTAVAGASYTVSVDTTPDFFAPIVRQTLSDTFYTPDADLPRRDLYVRVSTTADSELITQGVLRVRYVVGDFAIPFIPSQTHNTTPTFLWHPVDGATSYDMAYGYGYLDTLVTTTDTFFTAPAALRYTTYTWTVYAHTPDGPLSSGPQTLQVTADNRPVLLPVLPSPTKALRPTLQWFPVSGATSYTVQISDGPYLYTFIDSATVSGTLYVPSVDLPYDTIYWSVRANTGSYTVFSPIESFIVSPTGADQDIMAARPASRSRASAALIRCQATKSLITVQGVPRGARVELFAASGQRLAAAHEQGGSAALRVPSHAAGLAFVRIVGAGSSTKTTPVVLR